MYAILLVNDYKEKERYEMKKIFIVLKKFNFLCQGIFLLNNSRLWRRVR